MNETSQVSQATATDAFDELVDTAVDAYNNRLDVDVSTEKLMGAVVTALLGRRDLLASVVPKPERPSVRVPYLPEYGKKACLITFEDGDYVCREEHSPSTYGIRHCNPLSLVAQTVALDWSQVDVRALLALAEPEQERPSDIRAASLITFNLKPWRWVNVYADGRLYWYESEALARHDAAHNHVSEVAVAVYRRPVATAPAGAVVAHEVCDKNGKQVYVALTETQSVDESREAALQYAGGTHYTVHELVRGREVRAFDPCDWSQLPPIPEAK